MRSDGSSGCSLASALDPTSINLSTSQDCGLHPTETLQMVSVNSLPLLSHTAPRSARDLIYSIHQSQPLDLSAVFFNVEVRATLAKFGTSTVASLDGLTVLCLRNIGVHSIEYLTEILALSHQSANIPAIRKQATIVGIPNADEPIDNISSCWPISPLCQRPSCWIDSSSLTLVWRCWWRLISIVSVLSGPQLLPFSPWHKG